MEKLLLNKNSSYSKDIFFSGLVFLYVFTFFVNTTSDVNDILIQLSLYSLILVAILKLIFSKEEIPLIFTIWYGIFVLLSLISFLYANSESHAILGINRVVVTFALGFAIAIFINQPLRINSLINAFIISGFVVGVIHITSSVTSGSYLRIGTEYGINPNEVGLIFSISACFAFYKLYIKQNVLFNTLAFSVSFTAVTLSGSKKAILGIFIFLLVYLLYTNNIKKFIKNIVYLSLILITGYIILFYNSFIYEIAGYRLELMFNEFLNDSGNDNSTERRMFMIKSGLEFFYYNPIFGVGINNFASAYSNLIGQDTYSHNNYIEVLVNLGMVGFITYYGIIILIVYRLLKQKGVKNSSKGLYWGILILVLFYDFATVSYYNPFIIVLISLLIVWSKKENITHFNK
ncbi:O-antigen ligase family protein [Planococcus sp. MERTA32b]|nr:O-antigen ligase family protein [Planococcus sp. MER TA 32b]